MQTECPHCHTLFRITEQQLEQADGQVQCGHCLAIFSAENPYNSQLQNDSHTDAKSPDENNIFDNENIMDDVVPAELRGENNSKTYNFLSSLIWSLAILALIITGLAQLAWLQREELVKYPQLQTVMEKACLYIKCKLPAPRDTKRIKLTSKNVYTHPNIEKALMINGTIVNQAEFSQAFPLLEIRFENIRGEVIAARRFKPTEYLGIPENQIGYMQPGEPVSFNIEVIDPGTDVVSYAFEFL